MYYSIIIPVYNRPSEVDELLQSICYQTYRNFEVIVVEDGSSNPCKFVVNKYSNKLPVHYCWKDNSGPGQTRNYGAGKSKGDYLLFLDSDCILPENYLMNIEAELQSEPVCFFGGPDKAHDSFTNIQKAINYSMTSVFTTGGIRGGKKRMDKFYPRSFNMGVSKAVFDKVGGFSEMRFGEDIDLSIRILKCDYKSRLFSESWVYHKRRTDFKKFFKQVFNSGMARINLSKRHPGSLKIVHIFPAFFTIGIVALPFFSHYLGVVFGIYFLLIFTDSLIKTKSLSVALLSLIAAFVQLFGYGCGFIHAFWQMIILRRNRNSAFGKSFYN
ncbi:MAG: glycosyltransferase [Candidatus Symbiothrix sp.]|jgi:glycosyltransferase involved in cell wall biosynthesis|nr:glycosyltransferase [Candidatus Symbiothrix sp.]